MYAVNLLPPAVKALLVQTYHLRDARTYQAAIVQEKNTSHTLLGAVKAPPIVPQDLVPSSIIFATDSYPGHSFDEAITEEVASSGLFVPRAEKAKELQKARTKNKAEVFTPSWVCNLQNNLIDEAVLGYSNAFNSESPTDKKLWVPTSEPIKFSSNYTWMNYITEKRLEMTCGEAPYLASPYDTVTGKSIPVRDKEGRFARIGLLDRKLRVAYENVTTVDDWRTAALYAFRATYGYEWQGDNLFLARLNLLYTYSAYLQELWGVEPTSEELEAIAEVISWNLWQMDGLKMVAPESCSSACPGCEKKARGGHNGKLAIIRMGQTIKSFESLGPADWFPVKIKQKQAASLF